MAPPHLGQRPRRRQAGLDRDAQQVGHVGELVGHPLAAPARTPTEPQVRREERGHGRDRERPARRGARAVPQRAGSASEQPDRRRAALDRHDVGGGDAAARRRPQRSRAAEVRRRRRRAGPASQRGQPRGQRAAPRRPRASRAPAPVARRGRGGRQLDHPGRRQDGRGHGEEQRDAHRAIRRIARTAPQTEADGDRGEHAAQRRRRQAADEPGIGRLRQPGGARRACSDDEPGREPRLRGRAARVGLEPRALLERAARSSRRSAARSPPASRCSRIAATSVSQPGSAARTRRRSRTTSVRSPSASARAASRSSRPAAPRRAARLGRCGERAADRVAGGQRVGQRARQRRRARPPARRASARRRAASARPAAHGRPRRPAPRRPTARRRAIRRPAASRPPTAPSRRRSADVGTRPLLAAPRRSGASDAADRAGDGGLLDGGQRLPGAEHGGAPGQRREQHGHAQHGPNPPRRSEARPAGPARSSSARRRTPCAQQ